MSATSETTLAQTGAPLTIDVKTVTIYYDTIGAGPYLSIALVLNNALLRNASESVRRKDIGYVVFERKAHSQKPWIATGISATPVFAPGHRLGIQASINSEYNSLSASISSEFATDERITLLERYPCRDLAAKVYVARDGAERFARFIPPRSRSAGPPCVTREYVEARKS